MFDQHGGVPAQPPHTVFAQPLCGLGPFNINIRQCVDPYWWPVSCLLTMFTYNPIPAAANLAAVCRRAGSMCLVSAVLWALPLVLGGWGCWLLMLWLQQLCGAGGATGQQHQAPRSLRL
jgi:hypothetical protein